MSLDLVADSMLLTLRNILLLSRKVLFYRIGTSIPVQRTCPVEWTGARLGPSAVQNNRRTRITDVVLSDGLMLKIGDIFREKKKTCGIATKLIQSLNQVTYTIRRGIQSLLNYTS